MKAVRGGCCAGVSRDLMPFKRVPTNMSRIISQNAICDVTTNAVYLVSFRKISHLRQLLQQDGVVADYE